VAVKFGMGVTGVVIADVLIVDMGHR
jgi:hypothetical protein